MDMMRVGTHVSLERPLRAALRACTPLCQLAMGLLRLGMTAMMPKPRVQEHRASVGRHHAQGTDKPCKIQDFAQIALQGPRTSQRRPGRAVVWRGDGV